MNRRPSTGVIIWAWVFILVSLFSIWDALSNYAKGSTVYPLHTVIVSVLLSIAYVYASYLVLNLKETGRKLVIYLGIISILVLPLYIQSFASIIDSPDTQEAVTQGFEDRREDIKQKFRPEHQEEALKALDEEEKMVKQWLPAGILFIVFIVLIPVIIFEVIAIWFFMRKKTKEQFQAQTT